MPQRKIIHIDMDAFYASVEQRDDPSLRGRPIAVGHDGPRGVVSTASYEARPYGVRSALPSVTARRLCPELIFVPARFDVYKAVSQQIRDIFREYTELVEPLSLDEAFLDVTHERSATLVAREIKARIRRRTELTASAGVSVNKMLAKIASDYRKPDGLFTIAPSEVEAFVAALPVERFFGIGAVTAERMHRMGIHTGADLRQWDEAALMQRFGKAGHAYYGYARGVDEREVEPHRVRKSVGAETTFAEDTDDRVRLSMELAAVREEVWNRIQRHEFRGKTVVLKLKYDDFRQITRSKTLFTPIDSDEALCRVSRSCSWASISTAARCGSSASRWATRPKPVPTACSCASTSARSDRFVGARRSIVSRTFSLYLYPYRTDYSGVLLLSLLLGLCPCEKEENVGEVIPPADQGQSTVVCTKSRARIGRGQRPDALALRVGHRAALPARRGRGVDARAGRGRRST